MGSLLEGGGRSAAGGWQVAGWVSPGLFVERLGALPVWLTGGQVGRAAQSRGSVEAVAQGAECFVVVDPRTI